MEREGSVRYDPVWRRIKSDRHTQKLEGQFSERFNRLDGLNNWGALGWLFTHATASKQAHHCGLEWNAMAFIGGSDDRTKHESSLRLAAHVAHWGHLPLSYAAEEALIRAAAADENTKSLIDGILSDVIGFGNLSCDADGHTCVADVRSGESPFLFYRWIAAWLVKRQWSKLRTAVNFTGRDESDHDALKSALVRTLVCRESRGFKVLERCNQADYVPRDLQQAGTAWLTFDIEALWEGNPLGADAAKEWSLIDAARNYLDARFFRSPDALLFHSLAARAIAGGWLAQPLTATALEGLTRLKDAELPASLPPYHRRRLDAIAQQGSRLLGAWEQVGQFEGVSVEAGSRLEIEDRLAGLSGKHRVSYPFNQGVSVVVQLRPPGQMPALVPRGRRLARVDVHFNTRHHERRARRVLDIVARIEDGSFPGDISNEVLSWLVGDRVEQRTPRADAICQRIAADNDRLVRTAVSDLLEKTSLQSVLKNQWLRVVLDAIVDESYSLEALPMATLLNLPWPVLRLASGRRMLECLRAGAWRAASEAPKVDRGYALEVAVRADQWLARSDRGVDRRFVFGGCTLLGKDGQPEQEWDVVRIDGYGRSEWGVAATECAIGRSQSKDDEARAKLGALQRRIVGRFDDFGWFYSLLATTNGDGLEYEDAGRTWVRQA